MSAIDRYIHRYSSGDSSCLDNLCTHLADRLVFVPTAEQVAANDETEGSYSVDILCLENEQFPVIPVFTSESHFQDWCRNNHHSPTQVLSLLGGDLCAALDKATGIAINLASELNTVLAPAVVHRVADIEVEDLSFEHQPPTWAKDDPRPSEMLLSDNPEISDSNLLAQGSEKKAVLPADEIGRDEDQNNTDNAVQEETPSAAFIMLDESMVQDDE